MTRRKPLPRSLLPHPNWWVGNPLTPEQLQENLVFRFWHYVDKTPGQGPQGQCWEWKGAKRPRGYGELGVYDGGVQRIRGAHVISYEQAHGSVPEGKYVCHTCDNPPCVRPIHLWVGTARQNQWDAQGKGRQRYNPERHNPRRAHRIDRLTDNQAELIKRARKERGLSVYDMGYMLSWNFTTYFKFENGKRSCRIEHLQFILKFLEISEETFSLRSEQIVQRGSADFKVRPGPSSTIQQPVRTYPRFAHQVRKSHILWGRIYPCLEHYRADLLINALKSKPITLLQMCRDTGTPYGAFRAVIAGRATRGANRETHLPAIANYAGLSMEQIMVTQQKVAA